MEGLYENGARIETRNGYKGYYIGPDPREKEGWHFIILDGQGRDASLIREVNLAPHNELGAFSDEALMNELARRGTPMNFKIKAVSVEDGFLSIDTKADAGGVGVWDDDPGYAEEY